MTDIRHLLQRQAEWQKARRSLSWAEKIRLVEALHDAIRQFRDMRTRKARSPLAESAREVSLRKPDVPPPGEGGEEGGRWRGSR